MAFVPAKPGDKPAPAPAPASKPGEATYEAPDPKATYQGKEGARDDS